MEHLELEPLTVKEQKNTNGGILIAIFVTAFWYGYYDEKAKINES